jgi:Fe-S-cluster containining protein
VRYSPAEWRSKRPAPKREAATVHLTIFGQSHELACSVRVGQTTPLALLEPARALSDRVTEIAAEHANDEGKSVTCERGCAACCRHLIPISAIEARSLADLVASMPAEKRARVRARFASAIARMEAAGMLDPSAPKGRFALTAREPEASWAHVSRRYFELWVDCPFLEDEACVIYKDRPMACREHQVTTPPDLCRRFDEGIEGTARPVRMSEVLASTASAVTGIPPTSIPLVLSLEWSEVHGRPLSSQKDGEAMFWAMLGEIDKDSQTPFDDR